MFSRRFAVGAIVAASVIALQGCGGRIETGHVGVRTNFNKSTDLAEIQPGFYGAVFTSVDEYVVKEIEVKFDNLTPKGKDNLVLADFDVSIWYQPAPDKIAEIITKYSGSSPNHHGVYYPAFNVVSRVAQGAIFDAVSTFESLTIHQKRNELEDLIKKSVQRDLDSRDKDVFTVTRVVVRQIKTDPALEKSIQAAVQMQKQTEAKNLEVKLAMAEAERLRVEAEGQAKANKIIAESLSEPLIRLKQIEAMSQFAHQGTNTVVLPSGVTPFVQVK